MIRVYKVTPTLGHQSIELIDPVRFDRQVPGSFTGRRMDYLDYQPIPSRLVDKHLPPVDFMSFHGSFAVSHELCSSLYESLSPSAQYIDLKVEGMDELYHAINITCICNALDKEKSLVKKPESGEILSIERVYFKTNRIDYSIFKLPETADHETFTISRGHPDDFYHEYMSRSFSGLSFELVFEQ